MTGAVTEDPELCFPLKEADSKIIHHIRVIVMSNDTDIAIYSLANHQRFCEPGFQELWVKFGMKDGRRKIPIHKLGHQLGGEKCSALLESSNSG